MSTKTRTEMGYGFFCGGDPRKFWPDGESCSEKEIENHKAACKLWDEAEARGETPTPEACPSGWVYDKDGKPVMHVLRAPYGIGTYEYEVEDDEAESPNDPSSPTATRDMQLTLLPEQRPTEVRDSRPMKARVAVRVQRLVRRRKRSDYCSGCGMLVSQCDCWDTINQIHR